MWRIVLGAVNKTMQLSHVRSVDRATARTNGVTTRTNEATTRASASSWLSGGRRRVIMYGYRDYNLTPFAAAKTILVFQEEAVESCKVGAPARTKGATAQANETKLRCIAVVTRWATPPGSVGGCPENRLNPSLTAKLSPCSVGGCPENRLNPSLTAKTIVE